MNIKLEKYFSEEIMLDEIKMIADRVRELRDILEIEVSEMAEKIGVSVEQYLQYENAEDDIPVGKLYLMASEFGVDPTVLLSGQMPRMEDYTVVRGGNGVTVERYAGYRFTSLAFNFKNRDMEPMIVSLLPTDEQPELVTHEGQEFNYVLEGKVAVTIGKKTHILEAGDSVYFNPALPHGQHAVDAPAKFLTVINE